MAQYEETKRFPQSAHRCSSIFHRSNKALKAGWCRKKRSSFHSPLEAESPRSSGPILWLLERDSRAGPHVRVCPELITETLASWRGQAFSITTCLPRPHHPGELPSSLPSHPRQPSPRRTTFLSPPITQENYLPLFSRQKPH